MDDRLKNYEEPNSISEANKIQNNFLRQE